MENDTKKKPARVRPRQIITRMTEDEFSAYQKRVEASKLSSQKYSLRCLLDDEKIYVIEDMPELIRQLKAIGNNLNQIARAANAGDKEPPAAVTELKQGVGELWQLLRRLRNPEKAPGGR